MKKKVLIIDDEVNLNEIVKSFLESNGYEVINAFDGDSGIEKARTESPNLILLDVQLPNMDGFEICSVLKSDEDYRHIPIILFSSKGSDSYKKTGQYAKADAYVTKPVELDELLSAVRKFV